MQSQCTHYSLYQRFFNRCLREWYVQREGGSGFHYADPPGILFTRLRSSKSQHGQFEAPILHWYFDKTTRNYRDVKIARLRPNVYGHSENYEPRPVESFLHIGYDVGYTAPLGNCLQQSKDSYHVSFCNDYDVAFNTLFNIGRKMGMHPEEFRTFENFRLITGNIYNIPKLLTEPYFKCVALSVSSKNFKHMMHIKTLNGINQAMTCDGCLIVLTRKKEILHKVKETLHNKQASKLFTLAAGDVAIPECSTPDLAADETLGYNSHQEDPEVVQFIRTLLSSPSSGEGAGVVQGRLLMSVYNKHVSSLPNQMLRRPVNTK